MRKGLGKSALKPDEPAVLCTCGERLAREVTLTGVTDITGVFRIFRRTTDHLVCPACHLSYPVTVVRAFVPTQPVEESIDLAALPLSS